LRDHALPRTFLSVSRDQSLLVSIGKKGAAKRSRPEDCPPTKSRKRRSLGAVAPLVKALADETRLAIVELLLGADDELCACDIEDAFDVSQSTISHHMRVLRESGLIDAERRGQWVYYAPTKAARAALDALVAAAAKSR
jgi:ArsR family transcriptional regulator